MKKLPFLIFAVVSLLYAGCKKETPQETPDNNNNGTTTGTLRVVFVPKYDGQNFDTYTDFTTPTNNRFQVELLKFFLSEFMVKSASDTTMVFEAFKFDADAATNEFSVSMTPGNYTGMRLSYGVPKYLNHKDPNSYFPVGHALEYSSSQDLLWTWASGFIFSRFEGRLDTTATGTGTLSQTFSIHGGNDTLYREGAWMEKNFTISANTTTSVTVEFDVKKFLYSSTDVINLEVDHHTDVSSNFQLAYRFAQMIIQSFSMP